MATGVEDKTGGDSREELRDLGLGTKIPGRNARLLNPDGTFNVERRGIPFYRSTSIYQALINTNWWRFNLIVVCAYGFVNMLFSGVYLALGIEHLVGQAGTSATDRFWDAFFFSAQTLTTVGYGRMSPVGVATSMVAAFESLMGLMGFALATGLLFARFARPRANLLFSKDAIIAPYRDGTAVMFRVANARKNQLIEAEVQVSLSVVDVKSGTRKFHDLPLERKQIHFFPLSWTIVHPIDAESPLWGFGPEEFRNAEGEFYVLMKAFDDTFSQTIYSRYSFRLQEVVYGAKFVFIFGRSDDGVVTIDLHRIGEHEPAELPILRTLRD